jgi:hypothetical protein
MTYGTVLHFQRFALHPREYFSWYRVADIKEFFPLKLISLHTWFWYSQMMAIWLERCWMCRVLDNHSNTYSVWFSSLRASVSRNSQNCTHKIIHVNEKLGEDWCQQAAVDATWRSAETGMCVESFLFRHSCELFKESLLFIEGNRVLRLSCSYFLWLAANYLIEFLVHNHIFVSSCNLFC